MFGIFGLKTRVQLLTAQLIGWFSGRGKGCNSVWHETTIFFQDGLPYLINFSPATNLSRNPPELRNTKPNE